MTKTDCVNELYTHIEAARAMLYSGKESQLLKDWLNEVEAYVNDYRQYLEGIDEGLSSREAWDEAGTDLNELRQGLLELERPDALDDLYEDAARDDKDAPTDFAKEVLEGYANALDEHLHAIACGLADMLERATYWQ